jgi:DNA segregation ATPase FtsK/SpoIIIE, S-DNA-T family
MAGYSDEYGAWQWLREHRVELGPLYLGVPALVLGVVAHLLDQLQVTLVIAALVIGCAFWIRYATGWRRGYYGIVGMAVIGWLVAAHLVPDTFGEWVTAVCVYLVAVILLAIPWWSDNVRRTHVRMEVTIRNWPIRAERMGLRDTWLTGMVKTDIGWTGKLKWRPGQYNVDKVMGMKGDLEGALGLNVGELEMPPDGRSTNSVNLVVTVDDPHAAPVMWDIPHTEIDGQLVLKQSSIKDLFDIGPSKNGAIKRVRLFVDKHGARSALIGGMPGSGKSGLLNLLWGQIALRFDAQQWGIDLKGGVELGPWARCFERVARTREDATLMLEALTAEMERRYEYMRKNGWRVWQPSAENPVIVLSVDEAASLLGNANSRELALIEDIARKGRAVGVCMILATQYPTLDALGSTQVREQIHFGFVFRMRTSDGEAFIVEERIDAHKIDANRSGTCYVKDGDQLDRSPVRCFYLDDETVEQTAELAAGLAPILVAEIEAFLEREVPGFSRLLPEDVPRQRGASETDDENGGENDSEDTETIEDWEDGEGLPLSEITRARDENLTEIEQAALNREREDLAADPVRLEEGPAYDALVAALAEAGDAGIRAAVLADVATRGRSWTYDKLQELEQAGRVGRTTEGTWAWITQEAHAG